MILLYKIINKTHLEFYKFLSSIYVFFTLKALKINIGKDYRINGFPRFILKKTSNLFIGDSFALNSGNLYNPIGRNQRSIISLGNGAEIKIGNNVGMSSCALICREKIIIGNNVRIGGNTIIYDTDFHSINFSERTAIPEITKNIKTKEVIINENVFIGGHSVILKGVTIGKNSIVGAGSVVTRNIPPNEIWGGNPAKFIKKI